MGMRSCDSRCLFSGSKGEVCCVEPLRTPPDLKDHPITCYSLLAMASLTKVRVGPASRDRTRTPELMRCFFGVTQILVIGLKPSLNVWMTLPYTKVTLPFLLSVCCRSAQDGGKFSLPSCSICI